MLVMIVKVVLVMVILVYLLKIDLCFCDGKCKSDGDRLSSPRSKEENATWLPAMCCPPRFGRRGYKHHHHQQHHHHYCHVIIIIIIIIIIIADLLPGEDFRRQHLGAAGQSSLADDPSQIIKLQYGIIIVIVFFIIIINSMLNQMTGSATTSIRILDSYSWGYVDRI